MNIIVHLMFAVTLRKRLKQRLGISLNLPGFLYGNILPDISKKYGLYPHYMRDALSHVISSNEKIVYESTDQLYSYNFAKELGAINHYMSDFFCHPHTDGYLKSKAYHGYYELKMIANYRKGLRILNRLLKKKNYPTTLADLRMFILENSKVYSRRKVSDVNDIGYALFAGIIMIEHTLIRSMNTSSEFSMNAQAV